MEQTQEATFTLTGDESEAISILKAHILASEKRTEAETTLDLLKPKVEAVRAKYGKVRPTREKPEPEASVILGGKFRDKNGAYKVIHVVTGRTNVSHEIVQGWLAQGIITQAMYEAATSYSDGTHNRVSFKAGQVTE